MCFVLLHFFCKSRHLRKKYCFRVIMKHFYWLWTSKSVVFSIEHCDSQAPCCPLKSGCKGCIRKVKNESLPLSMSVNKNIGVPLFFILVIFFYFFYTYMLSSSNVQQIIFYSVTVLFCVCTELSDLEMRMMLRNAAPSVTDINLSVFSHKERTSKSIIYRFLCNVIKKIMMRPINLWKHRIKVIQEKILNIQWFKTSIFLSKVSTEKNSRRIPKWANHTCLGKSTVTYYINLNN